MKFLNVTDLHFNRQHFEWVHTQRKTYDAICITGGFLSSRHDAPLPKAEQSRWVRDWLEQS